MRRRVAGLIAVFALVMVIVAVLWAVQAGRKTSAGPIEYGSAGPEKAVPAAAASPADDGNWTMPGKDYASTRFSGLDQINPANVGALKVEFTFSTGTTEGFEAPPLVVDNTMYVVAPWPNNIFALDLTKPGAPTKWVYEPKPAAAAK